MMGARAKGREDGEEKSKEEEEVYSSSLPLYIFISFSFPTFILVHSRLWYPG